MPSVYWMKKNLQPNERSCSDHFKNRVLTMGGTLKGASIQNILQQLNSKKTSDDNPPFGMQLISCQNGF